MTDPRPTDAHLHIFARWPEPGKAKTRLIPAFGADGAAAIYTRLLAHTVAVAKASGLDFTVRATGASPERFRQMFGEEVTFIDQGEGDLSAKLSRVPAPGIVIGSDCPGLTPALLLAARDTLVKTDGGKDAVVIGPARDGGYYLLGFAEDAGFAFADMAWSTDTVFAETVRRFVARGIRPAILPELSDIDTADDLADWPEFRM
ncbi:MAG: TIGR04282 family arsenosugar biosynthesis glycosyltransferase [Parerythrobacter sp.]